MLSIDNKIGNVSMTWKMPIKSSIRSNNTNIEMQELLKFTHGKIFTLKNYVSIKEN